MPTFYDTHITPGAMCRDNAFRALDQVAKLRANARYNEHPRSLIISHARMLILQARGNAVNERMYGVRLP